VTKKRKWILCSVIGALLALVGWAVASIRGDLRDSYGQWVTAELIIRFQQQRGRLPAGWQELEPVYGDGRGLHHGGLNFTQVQQRVAVEFSRLPELQSLALTTTNAGSIPTIIRTKSGRSPYWQGAEPNRLIYEYFVGQARPNPQGGANRRQPFSSGANSTSAAAASRRSP
jgi:hypothetical protein